MLRRAEFSTVTSALAFALLRLNSLRYRDVLLIVIANLHSLFYIPDQRAHCRKILSHLTSTFPATPMSAAEAHTSYVALWQLSSLKTIHAGAPVT